MIQKALIKPLQHVNFQKFSGGACPRTPLQPFLFLNQLQISSAEKNTLEIKRSVTARHLYFNFTSLF